MDTFKTINERLQAEYVDTGLDNNLVINIELKHLVLMTLKQLQVK